MTKKENLKKLFYLVIVTVVTIGVSISIQSLLANWQAPTAAPPDINVVAPINRGVDYQDKTGTLGVASEFFVGNLSTNPIFYANGISNNAGIGTSSPAAKFEVVGGSIKATGGLIIQTVNSQANEDAMIKKSGQIWLRTDL